MTAIRAVRKSPGRMFTALTVPGGSVAGTTNVNGYALPVDLTLRSRTADKPTEYVATQYIDLTEGFESGDSMDMVTAYIADTSYAGTGNGGFGPDGVAGGGKYRYGFNGKENDNEVKGVGDQIDYGKRIYDPRIGRFQSGDPLTAKFPFYSTYQFSGNMPIWANDLDGLEPNLTHRDDGINGVGLFDQRALGSTPKHSAAIRVGTKDQQFQIQWLLNNNGATIGYLASRVVPEEEYKRLYGGSGEGLQPAFVIALDKFGDFSKHIEKYYDISHNAELEDVMYGEIDRDPVKRFFDPRAWLVGRVLGITGGIANRLLTSETLVLSKADRLSIFQDVLKNSKPAASQEEAIKMINSSLDMVEDAYSGVRKVDGIPDRDDGRMYGILDEKYVKTMEDGTKVANTKGNRILLKKDGGFEIQTKDGSKTLFSKPGVPNKP